MVRAMSEKRLILCFAVLACSLLDAWGQSPAERPLFVLLKNGAVLEGKVRFERGRYCVLDEIGATWTTAKEVLAVCDSLAECSRRMAEQVSLDDLPGRVELIRWRLRQGLVEEAGEELAGLERITPNHPFLRSLAAEIELARRPKKNEPVVLASANVAVRRTPEEEIVHRYGEASLDAVSPRDPAALAEKLRRLWLSRQPRADAAVAAGPARGTHADAPANRPKLPRRGDLRRRVGRRDFGVAGSRPEAARRAGRTVAE